MIRRNLRSNSIRRHNSRFESIKRHRRMFESADTNAAPLQKKVISELSDIADVLKGILLYGAENAMVYDMSGVVADGMDMDVDDMLDVLEHPTTAQEKKLSREIEKTKNIYLDLEKEFCREALSNLDKIAGENESTIAKNVSRMPISDVKELNDLLDELKRVTGENIVTSVKMCLAEYVIGLASGGNFDDEWEALMGFRPLR